VASALQQLRVLDFSRVLAGPFATMMLGDLGAEVTKVERPGGGDETRSWGPPFDERGEATYFQAVNRNKSSLRLDLADPGDLAEARRLALEADVLVENFRPDVMASGCAPATRASSTARSPASAPTPRCPVTTC
jgi:crotonobetainyl-CoA:carnitine CoA-transferase CaiB-like acyl-CoA transferase